MCANKADYIPSESDFTLGTLYFVQISTHRGIERLRESKTNTFTEAGVCINNTVLELEHFYADVFIEKHTILPSCIFLILRVKADFPASDRYMISATPFGVHSLIARIKKSVTDMTEKRPFWKKSFYITKISDERKYKNICMYMDKASTNITHKTTLGGI